MATELSKQESAQKEVKSTHRKILEKREEYAARASEVSEDQRKLRRFVGFCCMHDSSACVGCSGTTVRSGLFRGFRQVERGVLLLAVEVWWVSLKL